MQLSVQDAASACRIVSVVRYRHSTQSKLIVQREILINLLPKLRRSFCNPLAKQLGGFQIARQWAFVGRRVGRALRHCAGERAEEIAVVALGGLGIGRHRSGADPDHALLHRQGEQVVQGR